MLRLLCAPLVSALLSPASCVLEPALPAAGKAQCTNDGECPPTWHCTASVGRCFSPSDDRTPPAISDVVFSTRVGIAGDRLALSIVPSERLFELPAVFVDVGSERRPAAVVPENDGSFEVSYDVVGDEVDGLLPVITNLVDRAGNESGEIIASAFSVDTGPVIVDGDVIGLTFEPRVALLLNDPAAMAGTANMPALVLSTNEDFCDVVRGGELPGAGASLVFEFVERAGAGWTATPGDYPLLPQEPLDGQRGMRAASFFLYSANCVGDGPRAQSGNLQLRDISFGEGGRARGTFAIDLVGGGAPTLTGSFDAPYCTDVQWQRLPCEGTLPDGPNDCGSPAPAAPAAVVAGRPNGVCVEGFSAFLFNNPVEEPPTSAATRPLLIVTDDPNACATMMSGRLPNAAPFLSFSFVEALDEGFTATAGEYPLVPFEERPTLTPGQRVLRAAELVAFKGCAVSSRVANFGQLNLESIDFASGATGSATATIDGAQVDVTFNAIFCGNVDVAALTCQ